MFTQPRTCYPVLLISTVEWWRKSLLPRCLYHPRYDLVARGEPLEGTLSDEERERLGGRRDEAEVGRALDALTEREVRLLKRLCERGVHWDEA